MQLCFLACSLTLSTLHRWLQVNESLIWCVSPFYNYLYYWHSGTIDMLKIGNKTSLHVSLLILLALAVLVVSLQLFVSLSSI